MRKKTGWFVSLPAALGLLPNPKRRFQHAQQTTASATLR